MKKERLKNNKNENYYKERKMNKIKNFFKENELAMLYVVFAVLLVTANCVGTKLFTLGFNLFGSPVVLTVGAIVYPFTFLITDIIGEKFGKKQAFKAVLYGFLGQTVAIIFIVIAGYLPAVSAEAQVHYQAQLGQSFVFVIASLTAYTVSQFVDVKIFHKLKVWFEKKQSKSGKWIYNNVATITSQLLDTVIYAGIAFGLGFGYLWNSPMVLLNMILAQWLIKSVIALLDTPLFVFITRKRKNKAIEEQTKEEEQIKEDEQKKGEV